MRPAALLVRPWCSASGPGTGSHDAPLCSSAVSKFKLNVRTETVRGGFSDALEHVPTFHHLRLLLVFMPPHLAAIDLATLVRHRRALTHVAKQLLQRQDSCEHHVVLCTAMMTTVTDVPDVSLSTPRCSPSDSTPSSSRCQRQCRVCGPQRHGQVSCCLTTPNRFHPNRRRVCLNGDGLELLFNKPTSIRSLSVVAFVKPTTPQKKEPTV